VNLVRQKRRYTRAPRSGAPPGRFKEGPLRAPHEALKVHRYARFVRILAVSVALAVVAVAGASASAAKPKPVVPTYIQSLLRAKAGSLAYVPTRVPFAYRYVRYRWDAPRRLLTITLADRRFPVDGRRSIAVSARRFGATPARCGDGREKTLQMGGNKVYWDGTVAWRCVRGPGGGFVRIAASGPNLPDVALGRVVASGKRVS
jgi:hypothetical protein